MRNTYILLTWTFMITLSSCVITFEQPQPVHARRFRVVPSELRGTYIAQENGDTLLVTNDSYIFKTNSSDLNQKTGSLKSGDAVLKKMKNIYILSRKIIDTPESFPKNIWHVYILEYYNRELKLSFLKNIQDEEQMVDSVRKIVPVREIGEKEDRGYVVNPSKKQFKKIVKSSMFKEAYLFKKISM